jgi:nucleoside-diphosphate-sugar epimerase
VRILVPGGAGFIGKHVVRALESDGHTIAVVDLSNGQDFAQWVPAMSYDACILLAAVGGVARARREPATTVGNNVACAINALGFGGFLGHIILASSFSVYGNTTIPTTVDAPIAPRETYAASKAMQELVFRGYEGQHTILRFSSVYGSGMRLEDPEATILAKIAGWVQRGEPCRITEDGRQSRDFVFVGDVIDTIRAVLDGRPCPPVLNVCSGVGTTLVDACAGVAYAMNTKSHVTVTGEVRAGDMRHCLGDAGPMTELLGRKPTSFVEGVCAAFS